MATTPLREALHEVETEIAAGRPGEALRRADQLLATHPRWLDAQRLRARALVATDRLGEAEVALDGILASNPEDGDAFCDRAYLMQRRGELLGALACYRRACELLRSNGGLRAAHNQLAKQLGRPPYTPSHTGLARLYLRNELFAHALREWDIALHANPNRLDAQIGMAETLWRSGDPKRARATCQHILTRMPTCLKPLLLLAFFHLEEGQATEAEQLVSLAGEMDPDQHVAGDLFGDLVASGHRGLADLFRAAVRSKTSPLRAPEGTGQTGVFPALAPSSSRPISEPLPTGQLATGPLFAASKPDYESLPTGKLSYPPTNGNGEIEDFFSQSRAAMLPENFDLVFRETEYMLWSRDNDEPNTAEIPAITPQTPPPADAETDMAFVRWLQEQGAMPLNGSVPAPASALSPNSPPATEVPTIAADSAAPVGVPPFLQQAMAEAGASSITPAPAPQAIERTERGGDDTFAASNGTIAVPPPPWLVTERAPAEDETPHADAADLPDEPTVETPATFAPPAVQDMPTVPVRLEPSSDVAAEETPIVVEPAAETPPPATEPLPVVVPAAPVQEAPPAAPAVDDVPSLSSDAPTPAPIVAEEPAAAHPEPVEEAPLPVPEPPPTLAMAPPTAAPVQEAERESAPAADPAPVTIEAIQQGLTSAGFARLETGRLATVASSLAPSDQEAPLPAGDVGARLDAARALRREGRVGEALAEYRTLVKAATDRLDEIIRDLRDAAIEAPHEAEVHRLLGDAYIREGDYVEALEAYNRASQLRQDEVNR